MQPERHSSIKSRPITKPRLGVALALAWVLAGAGAAQAADLVGTVTSTAGAAVGTVTGVLGGGGGGTSGGGTGGSATPRGGGTTSPSLAAFLTGNRDGGNVSGGGGSVGGGLHFSGQDGSASYDGFVLNARAESTLGYNVMVTKKILTW